MKLEILQDIIIDSGSPSPKVLSSDTKLFLVFYKKSEEPMVLFDYPEPRNTIVDKGIGVVEFKRFLSFKFGSPSSETLTGHPYYKYGLTYYAGHSLEQSPWIDTLARINEVHPYHDSEKFKSYNHYIFTFHDRTFECIAQSYQASYEQTSMFDKIRSLVEGITISEV